MRTTKQEPSVSNGHDHGPNEVCVDCEPPTAHAQTRTRPSPSHTSQSRTVDGISQISLKVDIASSNTGTASAPSTGEDADPATMHFDSEVGEYVGGETIDPPEAATFRPSVLIEFCDRCRWAPRSSWIQTELLLTFPSPILKSITLQPLNAPETGGRFRVWIYPEEGVPRLVWDRKTEGGFPELKVLKQRVRNILQPERDLGHSDSKVRSNDS